MNQENKPSISNRHEDVNPFCFCEPIMMMPCGCRINFRPHSIINYENGTQWSVYELPGCKICDDRGAIKATLDYINSGGKVLVGHKYTSPDGTVYYVPYTKYLLSLIKEQQAAKEKEDTME